MSTLVKWAGFILAILVLAATVRWATTVEQTYRANIRNGFPANEHHSRVCPFDARDPGALDQYLERVRATRQDPDCIGQAIGRLGDQHYAPAAPILVTFLDFRWLPKDDRGKLHWPYPAVTALAAIGDASLPSLLKAVTDPSLAPMVRENALTTWMWIYRYKEPTGVRHLRNEGLATNDTFVRELLLQAASTATRWCAPSEKRRCMKAAALAPASSVE